MLRLIYLLAIVGLCSAAIDIEKLLSKMTIEEKCGQMTQMTIEGLQVNAEVNNPDDDTINVIFCLTSAQMKFFFDLTKFHDRTTKIR